MPAPSPARGSAPTAPRCSRLQRMLSASETIWCDFWPLMLAMKPTPQESFSMPRSEQALGRRTPGHVRAPGILSVGRFRMPRSPTGFCHDVFALEFRPAHPVPLKKAKGLTASPAHLPRLRHSTGPPLLVLREPQFLKFRLQAFNVPEERPCLHCPGARGATVSLQSLCRDCPPQRQTVDNGRTSTMPEIFSLSHKRVKVLARMRISALDEAIRN